MIHSIPTLREMLRSYCLERELSDGAEKQLGYAVTILERFAGRTLFVSELTDDLVNEFLKHLKELGRSSHTRRTRRGSILCLWRAAAERGYVDPPLRVRRIKHAQNIVRAYSAEDMRALLTAATELHGSFPKIGIRRAVWFQSLLLAYWDTALRISDLLKIERRWIEADLTLSIVQNKTGRIRRARISPDTIAAIDACTSEGAERELVWPLWGRPDAFYRAFKRLRTAAGLPPESSSKWIRRGSASAIEATAPGTAWQHLGHARPGLDRQAYIDPTIADPAPRIPPPIFPP